MKIFEARRTGGVITADGGAVIDCPVLGEGGDSEGVIVMAENELVYIPKEALIYQQHCNFYPQHYPQLLQVYFKPTWAVILQARLLPKNWQT